ncbi:hypothetical protein SCUP515_05215 [Seiridium cupressi]
MCAFHDPHCRYLLTQRWVLSAAVGYSGSVFYNIRQHTNSGSESDLWTGENTWPAGSAFAAILVLQLSCVFQPAGALIFDGAIAVLRLSPIYCLPDMGSTYADGLFMIIRYKISIAEAFAVIAAVRYQSFRAQVRDEQGIDETWPSLNTILIIASKRRILPTIIATISVLQYVKVLSIQGSADVTIPTQFLGTMYFLYWLTNELVMLVLSFSTTKLDAGYTLAVDVWPLWAHPSSTSNPELFRLCFALFGGCCQLVICIAVAMTVFQIGTSGLKVHGEPVSGAVNMFFSMTVLVVPLCVFYACL